MAVTPVNPESIGANECNLQGTDIRWHHHGIEERTARHFVDTLGTRTGEPKLPRGQPRRNPAGDPLEENPIIAASDRGWDRRGSARTALLGYLSTRLPLGLKPAPLPTTYDRLRQVSI